MPANWDKYQHINPGNHRVEWPTGPMTLNSGFAAKWVDAWVVQGGIPIPQVTHPGPSQSAAQSAGWVSGRWTAATHKWKNGNFVPGPALGISILASDNGTGTYEYHWWVDWLILL